MAITNRFKAKYLVATTLLAAGGVGAYVLTSGNGAPWSHSVGHAADESSAPKMQSSDLDIVASAWAESSAPKSHSRADSSTSARSANETLAHADTATNTFVGNRYGENHPPQTSTVTGATTDDGPSDPAEITTTASGTLPAPANSVAGESVPVQSLDEDVEQVASFSESEPTIARGQDATDAPASTAQPIALQDASGAEPQASIADAGEIAFPAGPAGSTTGRDAAIARARQAFNEQPASSNDGNRYSQASAASLAAESGSPRNPFAASPASQSASLSSAVPTSPANVSSSLPENGPFSQLANANSETGPTNSAEPRAAATGFDSMGYRNASENSKNTSLMGSSQSPGSGGSIASGGDQFASGNTASTGAEGSGRPGERALEGAQNPALVIQKTAPPEIQVNKPARFVTQVRNVGGQAAADVVIQDQIPKGTRLLSSSPPAEVMGDTLTWRVGTLSIGEERKIELQLMPIAEGEIGSVATVSYSAQASVKTRSTMPQLAIRMTSPKQVMVGQEQRVKIFLQNPGTGDATGVMLFENVPENVRHAAGSALEFEIGTLRAGETRELELSLLAEKAGKVVNVLTARADGNLQVQHQVEFEVIAPALTVAVVGPERRYLEHPATYAVRVENPGTAPAHDIQLVTKLPKGMKFVRANNMGEYDASTHAVYWSLAELPEGEHGSVELVAIPTETGPQTLEVEGHAQQGLSDQTKHPIVVEGLAAIMFEVRDLEDPIEVGRETGYEIRVVNQGTKAASNVQVAVSLPPGMQVISADGETQHSVQPGGLIFAPLRQLAPKADTIFRVKVQCQQPGDQRVVVEVKTDDLQPIRREESTRVFGDE